MTGQIKYALLQRLHRLYLSRKHKLLSSYLGGKLDTKAVWFENDDSFKKFCSAVIDPANKISGVRFYFCAYDIVAENGEFGRVPVEPGYVDQLTLAYVTTTLKDGKHEDVYDDPHKILVPAGNNGKLCPPDTGCEMGDS